MQNIAIFGVPRSGTSWLGQIFNSSPHVAYRFQPIFAYSFDGIIGENSSRDDIDMFHQDLLQTNDDFVCQKVNLSGNPTPHFEKKGITHLVWKEVRYLNVVQNILEQSSAKIIGIMRHPCGVIKSWVGAPREFNAEWDLDKQWRHAPKKNSGEHEFYGFERWIDAARMFIKLENEYPDQFKTVTYESLLEEGERKIEEIFNFAGLEITQQTKDFFIQSTTKSKDDPYGVYREKKDGSAWINELSPEIIQQILADKRFQEIAQLYEWNTD